MSVSQIIRIVNQSATRTLLCRTLIRPLSVKVGLW